MKNEEKISELSRKTDAQQKENMLKFMRWLEKRGFIKEDLCYDTEHQVDTFINQILPLFNDTTKNSTCDKFKKLN